MTWSDPRSKDRAKGEALSWKSDCHVPSTWALIAMYLLMTSMLLIHLYSASKDSCDKEFL